MRNLFVMLGFLMAGCSMTFEYPDDWPALESRANGCPNISGVYAELGRTSEYRTTFKGGSNITEPRLSQQLLRLDFLGPKAMKVTQPSSTTVAVSAIGAGWLYEAGGPKSPIFDLGDGDYKCEEGKIWFPRPVGLTKWRNRIGFSKAVDGSLVAEHHQAHEIGHFLFFYLWPAYSDDPLSRKNPPSGAN